MFVLVLVVVSILWIPVVQASQGGQLFIYIQSISSYLQPPVSIIFLMGCFWRRTNEKVSCVVRSLSSIYVIVGRETVTAEERDHAQCRPPSDHRVHSGA